MYSFIIVAVTMEFGYNYLDMLEVKESRLLILLGRVNLHTDLTYNVQEYIKDACV